MRIDVPVEKLSYRCLRPGDEIALHGSLPGSYSDVLSLVSDQLECDVDDDYRCRCAGCRYLVVVDTDETIGLVKVTTSEDDDGTWSAEVETWCTPTAGCHPERSLDFANDALVWIQQFSGRIDRATVKAHVRGNESLGCEERTVEWSADPIPAHPHGTPRFVVFSA